MSKNLEINIPSNKSLYILPGSILLSSLFVSLTILFSFKPDLVSLSLGENKSVNNVKGISDFRIGSAKGKVGSFTEYANEPCKEEEKPVVFMFSASWCPHCKWIGAEFESWAKEQKDIVVYRYEVDLEDNTLTDEKENGIPKEHLQVYEQFNPNQSIPTFVFGCKYGRVGNGFEGEDSGLKKEREEFDSLVKTLLSQ